jgi:hypothetical protein
VSFDLRFSSSYSPNHPKSTISLQTYLFFLKDFAKNHLVLVNMGSKRVDLRFTREQVDDFNTQGFKLCFAAGVANNPKYNVIAWCDSKLTI